MSRASKVETVTFHIDSVLKTAFAEIAAEEAKPVGELLRELVRERVSGKRAAHSRPKRGARRWKQRRSRRIRARPP
jgi:hypothetical protein